MKRAIVVVCCRDNIAKDVMCLYWLFDLNVIVEAFILNVEKIRLAVSLRGVCVSCRASHLMHRYKCKCSIIYSGQQTNIPLNLPHKWP